MEEACDYRVVLFLLLVHLSSAHTDFLFLHDCVDQTKMVPYRCLLSAHLNFQNFCPRQYLSPTIDTGLRRKSPLGEAARFLIVCRQVSSLSVCSLVYLSYSSSSSPSTIENHLEPLKFYLLRRRENDSWFHDWNTVSRSWILAFWKILSVILLSAT